MTQDTKKISEQFEDPQDLGKLRGKLEEKASKDYTWIVSKLWKSDGES